jgi:hypothetical protein
VRAGRGGGAVALDGVQQLHPVAGGIPPHFSATPTRSLNNWT